MNILEKFISIVQRISLRHLDSDPKRTGLEPLSNIRSAAVFIDANVPGAVPVINSVHEYFRSRDIKVQIIAITSGEMIFGESMYDATFIHKDDLNWYGKPIEGDEHPNLNLGEDLFLSLFPDNSYTVEYLARCSGARFKIGRKQISDNIYDLVISENGDFNLNQQQAFQAIMKFVEQIQY